MAASRLDTLFGLLPIHGHDIWLHAGTAALAGYSAGARGFGRAPRRRHPRTQGAGAAVAPEHRSRPDRRLPRSEV